MCRIDALVVLVCSASCAAPLPDAWSAPGLIDFGTVEAPAKKTISIVVTSRATTTIDILSIELPEGVTDPAYRILAVPDPQSIAAGDTATIDVQFAPNVDAEVQGRVRVSGASDDGPLTDLIVDLVGVGTDVETATAVVTLDAPAATVVGAVVAIALNVTNTGAGDLEVRHAEISHQSAPPGADVLYPAPPRIEFHGLIAPMTTTTIDLHGTPTAPGTYELEVSLLTNDPDQREIVRRVTVVASDA